MRSILTLCACAALAGCGSYRIVGTFEYQSECKPSQPQQLACAPARAASASTTTERTAQ